MERYLKKGFKQTKGITLIALIVTIIVLLILAAVTLGSVFGPGGLFKKADETIQIHKREQYREELQLIGHSLQPDIYTEGLSTEEFMARYIEDIRRDKLFEEAQKIEQLDYPEEIEIQVVTKEGWVFLITEDNVTQIEEIIISEPTPIYVALFEDTLKFYDSEENVKEAVKEATANGITLIKEYGDIKDIVFNRGENWKGPVQNRPWKDDIAAITKIEFVNLIRPTNINYYFADMTNIIKIEGIKNLRTMKVENMIGTFQNCEKLEELDVTGFNTSNVKDMGDLFNGCKKLKKLDVSHFNTQNVRSMAQMFQDCEELELLDVSHFNTQNVKIMCYMFSKCKKVAKLDVSNFDTCKVTDIENMFESCESLEMINASHFDTSKCIDMSSMFLRCSNLKILDVSNFTVKNDTYIANIFKDLSTLKKLNISNFDLTSYTGNPWEAFVGIPVDCEIITNENMAEWFSNNDYSFTNIKTN